MVKLARVGSRKTSQNATLFPKFHFNFAISFSITAAPHRSLAHREARSALDSRNSAYVILKIAVRSIAENAVNTQIFFKETGAGHDAQTHIST
jgi:hypothetical protein